MGVTTEIGIEIRTKVGVELETEVVTKVRQSLCRECNENTPEIGRVEGRDRDRDRDTATVAARFERRLG